MSDQGIRRISDRRPIALQVRLAFDDRGEFVDRYAVNISDGGIFIRSREPRPLGSRLRFELHLRTGEVVFAGEGTVRWRQLRDSRGLGLSGMGLQFDNLTPESQRILDEILSGRQAERLPSPVEGASPSAWAPLESFVAVPTPIETALTSLPPPIVAPAEATPVTEATPSPPPVRAAATGFALGIDFGWGGIRAAVGSNQKAALIPLSANGSLPTMAALDRGKLVVGEAARNAVHAGSPGVRGIAQLLGRWPGSQGAASWRKRQLADPRVGPNGRLAVAVGNQVHDVSAIAEALLRETKSIAEAHLKGAVTRVAFAIPTSWTDTQRHVLRKAAESCGLEVQQLVAQPLASALARYGPRGNRRVLSVHFGEGGIEAAVVEQAGHVFDLLCSTSDPNLGGTDMDVAIVESVLHQFEKETGFLVPESPAVFERVREAVSRDKQKLSEALDGEIEVDKLVPAGLTMVDLRQKLPRARILSLISPLLDKVADIVAAALDTRKLQAADIDDVLLFGSHASWTPLVRRIAEKVGREPRAPELAGDAAAIGAALVADGVSTLGRYVMASAVGATVGVGLPGGGFKRVVERNLALPIERGYTVSATHGQQELELHLFQGERTEAFDNEYVGALIVGPLAPSTGTAPRIALTIMVDASGELSVRGRDVSTGKQVPVSLDRNRPPDSAKRALLPG